MPGFDVLGLRPDLSRVLVQVKTKRPNQGSWLCGTATDFLEIELAGETQRIVGRKVPVLPDLYWVFVALGADCGQDEFFVLSTPEFLEVVHRRYGEWLDLKDGKRPVINPVELRPADLVAFRSRWQTLDGEIHASG